MSAFEHISILGKGVAVWNEWRKNHPEVKPDLRRADLDGRDLRGADLRNVDLENADLHGTILGCHPRPLPHQVREGVLEPANLQGADLTHANLPKANLCNVNLSGALLDKTDLRGALLLRARLDRADLTGAFLNGADLRYASLEKTQLAEANLSGADLQYANLKGASFFKARLPRANLQQSNLEAADLTGVDLSDAVLDGADLSRVILVDARLSGANLNHTRIYGISAWDVELDGVTQKGLIVTQRDKPVVTVDDLEVAQFIYLLLNRKKLRNVLATITSKVVLILGRFTPKRKAILNAMAEELRRHDLLPIIFDFERATNMDFTETIKVLAGLSLFVIVDVTKPRAVPQELQAAIPDYQKPFVLIMQKGEEPYSMLRDFNKYEWVLKPLLKYPSQDKLLAGFKKKIIDRAWKKHKEIQRQKNEEMEVESIEEFME